MGKKRRKRMRRQVQATAPAIPAQVTVGQRECVALTVALDALEWAVRKIRETLRL